MDIDAIVQNASSSQESTTASNVQSPKVSKTELDVAESKEDADTKKQGEVTMFEFKAYPSFNSDSVVDKENKGKAII